MKTKLLYCYLLFFTVLVSKAQVTIPIYDNVLFYDGYAATVSFPTTPDVVRLRNDLFTKKLTPEILTQVGSTLSLNISISAACDNYDRIGNINLAFVPKNATSYDLTATPRIELGRYITPFMNKNVPPNLVPYTFNIDNVAKILKDTYLNSIYDFWIEFELFGVPYAAQTQIAGCSGRNDVFFGTLNFITNTTTTFAPNNTYVRSLNFKKILNDYQAGATDVPFQTVRIVNFNLPNAINNSKFYLISSNHGANAGGEEYNRRWHYVTFNGASVLTYLPGESTCEPYRIYNTQGNGIYGASPMTPTQWQSFSNWCPGAVIPIREITLGNLAAGNHTFRLSVPDAVFASNEGYFPISLYLQGENTVLDIQDLDYLVIDYYPNPTHNNVVVNSKQQMDSFEIFDILGKKLDNKNVNSNDVVIDFSSYPKGVYLLKIKIGNEITTNKIVKE